MYGNIRIVLKVLFCFSFFIIVVFDKLIKWEVIRSYKIVIVLVVKVVIKLYSLLWICIYLDEGNKVF